MSDEEKKESPSLFGISTLDVIFGVLMLVAGALAVYFYFQANKQRDARIEAQNKVAELSIIVQENEGTVSRLSQEALSQKEIAETLKKENETLFKMIEGRDEQISTLTNTIIRIRPTRIIIREGEGANETREDDRLRVSFDRELDPIRVQGFTLTNPAEVDLNVSFTRPLKLTTTVTQSEDGAWRTYVVSDWGDLLEIESIDTTVNPLPVTPPRLDRNNLSIGAFVGANALPFSTQFSLEVLYRLGRVHVGPGIGAYISGKDSGVNIGLGMSYELL